MGVEGWACWPERPTSVSGPACWLAAEPRLIHHTHSSRPAPPLQHLNMIQYMKGQHVICAAPHVIEEHLRKCGSAGLEVDPTKIVWCPVRGAGGEQRSRGLAGACPGFLWRLRRLKTCGRWATSEGWWG